MLKIWFEAVLATIGMVLMMIVSLVVSIALQIIWTCTTIVPLMLGAIATGAVAGVVGEESFSLTLKQQTLAQWLLCWPLLSEIRLVHKCGQLYVARLSQT